ncbi:MAG: YncE family protein [Planctomycetota bacterium]
MFRTQRGWFCTLLILSAAFSFTACGGGGGGGGGGNGNTQAQVLSLTGFPAVGELGVAGATAMTISYQAPSNSLPMRGVSMPESVGGVNFIQLDFNRSVLASSILGAGSAANNAVSVVDSAGNILGLFLDSTGALDPSNTFLSPNEAPSTVRLYVRDPSLAPNDPPQPAPFPAGSYTLTVLAATVGGGGLIGADGTEFCLISQGGSCTNDVIIRFPFTVGTDTDPIAGATTVSSPLAGQVNVATNQEISIFFDEAVDFQSIVGFNTATGLANTTQLDPYMSIPFTLNGPNALGENLVVTYTPPMGTAAPVTSVGYIVYMPDPFFNPTEVRIRFVDILTGTLSASDTFPATQNYGIDPLVYENGGLTAPVNRLGVELSLPTILPLPGSLATTPATMIATLAVTFLSMANPNALDTSAAADGVIGITDRDRNPMLADITVGNLNLAVGPPIANNPTDRDYTAVADGSRLRVHSSGRDTVNGAPGNAKLGTPVAVPVPLDDFSVLGAVLDVEFGATLNGGPNYTYLLANQVIMGVITIDAPRRNASAAIIAAGGDPAIPFPQAGASENSVNGLLNNLVIMLPQPLGTFLYVADADAGQVKVFNSNTNQQLGILQGVPNPGGLGANPAGTILYVTNRDQGTLQRVDLNPASPNFNQVTGIVTVGLDPRAVSVQRSNEDVFVLNTGENTVSRIIVGGLVERIRLAVGNGPRDVFTSPRWVCTGCTWAYQAYITNFFDGTVSVFESDSLIPQVTNTNGVNGKIFQTEMGFQNPSYGCFNGGFGAAIGALQKGNGFHVANSNGNSVVQIEMVGFNLGPQPGFQGPPAFRTFINSQELFAPAEFGAPNDASISPNDFFLRPSPNPAYGSSRGILNVIYPGASRIACFDRTTGAFLGSVITPGTQLFAPTDE